MITHTKRFMNPVYKAAPDTTNRLIEVNDSVTFILKDGSTQGVTVASVSGDGKTIGWVIDNGVMNVRREDVRAVESAHHFSCAQYGGAVSPHAGGDPVEWPEE